MPVILATQEADIRRITVESQAGQTVGVTLSQKKAGRAAQGVGPEFRPQYCKKKNQTRFHNPKETLFCNRINHENEKEN
jgi:hypothetical protein